MMRRWRPYGVTSAAMSMTARDSWPKPWNEHHSVDLGFRIGTLTSLPPHNCGKRCPNCGSSELAGVIIVTANGSLAVPDSDAADPNIYCMTCGYWWD